MTTTTSMGLPRILKVAGLPVLSLFLIPLCGMGVAAWGAATTDRWVVKEVGRRIDEAKLSPDDAAAEKAFYAATPPSVACRSDDARLAGYRQNVCSPGDDAWQFMVVARASFWLVMLGLAGVLGALGLGLLSWARPSSQHAAVWVGWRGFAVLSAVQVVCQGALLTWLSFWVTALSMHVYLVKLVLIAALAAAGGAWVALRGIFRRVKLQHRVEGEALTREQAPALWARLESLASRVGTAAPASVVAGIDDSFFVTEAPLLVDQQPLSGRTLFVSLPLLRVLESSEADAVMAHELAHFREGDTTQSAKLGPLLLRYDRYLHELGGQPTALPAFYLMRLFREVFELASRRSSRERELIADRIAVEHTSANDLGHALLKVTAYASHRSHTEQALFSQSQRHQATLGIAERVALGLRAHVASPQFQQLVQTVNVPHPYDSHPALEVRLQQVSSTATVGDCERLVASRPLSTWLDDVAPADEVEQRLWATYEARFQQAHENSLAWRYLPVSDEERALVEKYFPPRQFEIKRGGIAVVRFDAFSIDGDEVRFADIETAQIVEGNYSVSLVVVHPGGKIDFNLGRLGGARDEFRQVFGTYLGRAQHARTHAEGRAE